MIIDLQRRLAEIGRIRIGVQIATSGGRTRPAKLDTFRLTSADRLRIDQAAHRYGGNPQTWDAPAGKQWQVTTTADVLDVIVPPSDMAFSQHYELWAAGGCQRRCDGRSETISEGDCLCDPEQRECAIHSRLSVLLRDLPGLGVWRIDTSGYYAAVELQGAVEVIQMAAVRGQMLPARLRLEQRVVKRVGPDGKPLTRRFAVPVLDVEITPGQLVAGTAIVHPQLEATPPPAIETHSTAPAPAQPAASLTPVPDTVATKPTQPIADQMTTRPAPPQRRGTKQTIPSTGLQPRTVTQATQPAPDEPPDTPPADQPEPADTPKMSPPQQRKMHALFRGNKLIDRDERIRYTADVIGHPITTSADLTVDEATAVIDALQHDLDVAASIQPTEPQDPETDP